MKLANFEVRIGSSWSGKIFCFDNVEDAMCFAQLAFDGNNGSEDVTITLVPEEEEQAEPAVTHLDEVTE